MKGYSELKSAISGIVSEITSWITMLAGLGLALLILATVSAKVGYPVRIVPALDHVALAYVCGAWYLFGRR